MANPLTPRNPDGNPDKALQALRRKYFPQMMPQTVNDVFESGMPALAEIRREKGAAVTRSILVLLVNDTLDFFNVPETMNAKQVAITVDLIIDTYPYMQVDDITLCFRNAMKGNYGRIYNRIDGQIILGWLREYNKERCAAAVLISYNEHKAHLSEEARPTQGIFYADYRADLERRAKEGDPEAVRALALSDKLIADIAARRHDKARADLERFYAAEEERKRLEQDNI